MICPNCGRRNSAGATFCSRCHQRLPLADKVSGNHRRMVMVEPRGGGGSGAVVLAVALLAGFLFIGGAAVIYLSQPPASSDPSQIAFASGTPTLPPFIQPTPTPSPSATPTFIILPSDSPSFSFGPTFSVLPTDTSGFPTPQPTPTPQVTPTPAPATVVAKFACAQVGTTTKVACQDHSTGPINSWLWDFGDNKTSPQRNPPQHPYASYGSYTVTLTVTGPGGTTSTKSHSGMLQPPPSATPTTAPTATPTTPTPTPCMEPTAPPPTATPYPSTCPSA